MELLSTLISDFRSYQSEYYKSIEIGRERRKVLIGRLMSLRRQVGLCSTDVSDPERIILRGEKKKLIPELEALHRSLSSSFQEYLGTKEAVSKRVKELRDKLGLGDHDPQGGELDIYWKSDTTL